MRAWLRQACHGGGKHWRAMSQPRLRAAGAAVPNSRPPCCSFPPVAQRPARWTSTTATSPPRPGEPGAQNFLFPMGSGHSPDVMRARAGAPPCPSCHPVAAPGGRKTLRPDGAPGYVRELAVVPLSAPARVWAVVQTLDDDTPGSAIGWSILLHNGAGWVNKASARARCCLPACPPRRMHDGLDLFWRGRPAATAGPACCVPGTGRGSALMSALPHVLDQAPAWPHLAPPWAESKKERLRPCAWVEGARQGIN